MMKPMIFAALALGAACSAPAQPQVYTVPPTHLVKGAASVPVQAVPEIYREPATCRIHETKTAKGVRLEAVAHAGRSVYGEYDFTINAYSSGGSSDITQGGPVDLAAGERATVGSAEIPRGRYRAVLTLSDAGGDLCRLERRS